MKNAFVAVLALLCAGAVFVAFGVWLFSETGSNGAEERPHASHEGSLAGRKVVCLTNPPHVRSSEALAEWFHEETGAVVQNVVVNYEDMLRFTLRDLACDTSRLDVILMWYADLGTLVEKGALEDLTEFISTNREVILPDDFIPSLYDPFTLYKNRRWALPYDGDTHVLFYRKSLLLKYGFSPPETWDDYLHIAQTITTSEKAEGIYGTAIMVPPIPMISISSYMDRLGCYGGRLLDGDGRPVVNSPEAVAALSAMVEQTRYALPTPLETDWEVSRDAFLSGRVAMAEQWTDVGVMAEDPTQSLIRGDWGVAQMPKGSGDKASHAPALNAGFSLAISSRASDVKAAHAFLLFATRPDTTLRLNLINGGIDPTRISVLTSSEYRKFAPEVGKAAQAALKGASAWPTVPEAPELLDVLAGNLVMAVEGLKAPQKALDDTQARWVEILAGGRGVQ